MSYSNQTFPNFQFSPRSPTRRIASAGTAVDMSLVHSYQQNTTIQSPAGNPYNAPSYVGTPTSATSTAAPYSRYNPSVYSQAQASTSSLHQQYPPQSNLRRPSVSPRRSTEGYNPRDYGVLTGREAGVATPIIPDPEDGSVTSFTFTILSSIKSHHHHHPPPHIFPSSVISSSARLIV
jgi:hypothetical protein